MVPGPAVGVERLDLLPISTLGISRGGQMREIPKVYLISEPYVNTAEMLRYLQTMTDEHDGGKWFRTAGAKIALHQTPHAVGLVEFIDRLNQDEWDVRDKYVFAGNPHILRHSTFTFIIRDGEEFLFRMDHSNRGTVHADIWSANIEDILEVIEIGKRSYLNEEVKQICQEITILMQEKIPSLFST